MEVETTVVGSDRKIIYEALKNYYVYNDFDPITEENIERLLLMFE